MKLTQEEFRKLVDRALDEMPEEFLPYLEGLAVDVEPVPDRATLRSLGLSNPRDLLGLYHGTPLTERSVEHTVRWPERIVIYQDNIQRICRTRRQIVRQVRKTVLHEIGHHFGLEEDDLDELGYG
jgi:predicted Zn-dependent protease with MMP-like domain